MYISFVRVFRCCVRYNFVFGIFFRFSFGSFSTVYFVFMSLLFCLVQFGWDLILFCFIFCFVVVLLGFVLVRFSCVSIVLFCFCFCYVVFVSSLDARIHGDGRAPRAGRVGVGIGLASSRARRKGEAGGRGGRTTASNSASSVGSGSVYRLQRFVPMEREKSPTNLKPFETSGGNVDETTRRRQRR